MQLDNQLSLISAQVSQCPFLELGLILRSRSKQLWGKIRLMSLEIAALLCLECCLLTVTVERIWASLMAARCFL